MDRDNSNEKIEEQSVLTLIQQIKDGLLNPKMLSKEQRLLCVDALSREGLTEVVIADILKVCSKTIQRDRQKNLENNSLKSSPEFTGQTGGEVLHNARADREYLLRLARSKDASPAEKIQAQYSAWKIFDEAVRRLQSLGYLPLQSQQITGDLYHHFSDEQEESLDELQKKLDIIETVAKEDGSYDVKTEEEIKLIKADIEKARIGQTVDDLAKKQTKEGASDENKKD